MDLAEQVDEEWRTILDRFFQILTDGVYRFEGTVNLAEQLDPEEWHKITDRFFAILSDGVHRFEGTLNRDFVAKPQEALKKSHADHHRGQRHRRHHGGTGLAAAGLRGFDIA